MQLGEGRTSPEITEDDADDADGTGVRRRYTMQMYNAMFNAAVRRNVRRADL